jgi:hypothetical protein
MQSPPGYAPEEEWIALHELVQEAGTADLDLGPCRCQLLLRYSLPYKHYLLQACQTGIPLPSHLSTLDGG